MTFTPDMYDRIREGARRSAAVIVPLVLDVFLCPDMKLSVVDVGCGEGAFAEEFGWRGSGVLALDESVAASHFEQYASGGRVDYMRVDLADENWAAAAFAKAAAAAEFRGDPRRIDLAVCLEVAEHLSPERAGSLVDGLCALAPVVLFSAAIPGQGGHGHLNEQWPGNWADLFAAHRYLPVDCLRRELWDDERVEVWYRQNTLFYAAEGHELLRHPGLVAFDVCRPLALVHPAVYEWRLAELRELRGAS